MAAVYIDMLRSGGADATIPSLAELAQLCHGSHKINFLASTYIASQLRSFGDDGPANVPPSRVERLRVLRAFYRHQFICNAWAPMRRPEPLWTNQDTAAIGNTSGHQGVRLGLFAAFEPWELQQVDHANHFVMRLCSALCLAAEEIAQPISKAEFGDIFSHADHLVQYIYEHPSIADVALGILPSLPRLGSRAPFEAAPSYSLYIERYSLLCLEFVWQTQRSRDLPDPIRDKHEQQQQQEEEGGEDDGGGGAVDFVGDAVDLPPFGWVDALDGLYVNWFGNALVDFNFPFWTPLPDKEEIYRARHVSLGLWRDAGFALWGRRRVEAIKELDRLRTLQTG